MITTIKIHQINLFPNYKSNQMKQKTKYHWKWFIIHLIQHQIAQSLRNGNISTWMPFLVMILMTIPSPVEVSRSAAEINESLMTVNAFSKVISDWIAPDMFFRPIWLSKSGCSIAPAAPPARYLKNFNFQISKSGRRKNSYFDKPVLFTVTDRIIRV